MKKVIRKIVLIVAVLFGCWQPSLAKGKNLPALRMASIVNHSLSYEQCLQRAQEIMGKLNLEVADTGDGAIHGIGAVSVAEVSCNNLDSKVYIQIAVASQNQEAADTIVNYLFDYLRVREH